jgi:phosphate transport system permease protein
MFRSRRDAILAVTLRSFALICAAIVLPIVGFLLIEAQPILQEVGWLAFWRDPSWNPTEGSYNLTPMLWGSLLATAGSVLLATPFGIGSALFAHYYAPAGLAKVYRQMLKLMAGIPSVIYGLWGLVILVPLIRQVQPPGTSLLAGIVILALMILPTIALSADASFAKVPSAYWQGTTALAVSRWSAIWHVAFPVAKSGIFAGIILATGRAIGETMAILMVCGNVVQLPSSLFEPMRTLTANIALEMAYATARHRSALFVSGLLLMGAIALLVFLAETVSQESAYE